MKQVLWTLLAVAAGAGIAAAAVVGLGLYDVAATVPHWQPVHSLLETAMHRSVRARARDAVPADLRDAARLDRGAVCFRAHCAACHGAPGQAMAPFARSMQPLPGPLIDAAARWQPAELYWITRHGIKMSGMPAWQHRLSDDDLWAVVAFVDTLAAIGTEDYRRWMARLPARGCEHPADTPADGPADAARGRRLLPQYACNGCHRIPGVTGSHTDVGPPLARFGSRALVAGRLANTPENVAAWLRDPAAIEPHTAMPRLELTRRDARDIAAFLAGLR